MKFSGRSFFYIVIIGLCLVMVLGTVILESTLESNSVTVHEVFLNTDTELKILWSALSESLQQPFAVLILQIIIIVIISRLFGILFLKRGQPAAIGEITAGLILGPSLLGWLFPGVFTFIFPVESLSNLEFISQIGLILFMFIIGMEMDLKAFRKKTYNAVIKGHANIIIPFISGLLLAYFLFSEHAPANISFLSFGLFMGVAMSITAFPVLTRLLQERRDIRSDLHALIPALTTTDNITAGILLAIVIAFTKADTIFGAGLSVVLAAAYLLIMLKIISPLLKRMGEVHFARETMNKTIVGAVFITLLFSSYVTHIIGIHVLFGAFMAGVIMPPNLSFRKVLAEKVEDITLVLLLPVFIVFIGLQTDIGLLNNRQLWITCIGVILVAVLSKFGGSTIAACFSGLPWKDSLTIGTLLNTRGLMALIVLGIGIELSLLSQELFTIMVIMTLVTTLLTRPAINWINKSIKDEETKKIPSGHTVLDPYKVLLSFGPAKKGVVLLGLADQMTFKKQGNVEFTALHLTPDTGIDKRRAIEYKRHAFEPIRQRASLLGIKLDTQYMIAEDVTKEIIRYANTKNFNLLLVGASQSLFSSNKLGGKVKTYLEDVKCDVGVLINKNFRHARTIAFLVAHPDDVFIMDVVKHFLKNNNSLVSIIDVNQVISNDDRIWNEIVSINEEKSEAITFQNFNSYDYQKLAKYDLVLLSHKTYLNSDFQNDNRLQNITSILVMKKGTMENSLN